MILTRLTSIQRTFKSVAIFAEQKYAPLLPAADAERYKKGSLWKRM